MEAALAEFKAEDLGQDMEEDNDFVVQFGKPLYSTWTAVADLTGTCRRTGRF